MLDTVVSGPFYIKEFNSGKIVYEGLVSQPRLSAFSEKETVVIPFSQLRTIGTYFIEIPEIGKSLPFEIKDSLFHPCPKHHSRLSIYNVRVRLLKLNLPENGRDQPVILILWYGYILRLQQLFVRQNL